MNDPIGDRLRLYYQSIQTEPPARLASDVSRGFDLAPAHRGLRFSWRPAAGLAVVAVAVLIAALILRGVGPVPVPTPSGPVAASESASPSFEESPSMTAEPSERPSETPGATQSETPTSSPTPSPTPTATPTPTPTPFPTPLPYRGGSIVSVGVMNPHLTGPAVNLNDATVLVVGGMVANSDGVQVKSNLAELYRMGDHSFVPVGPMNDARYGHTITQLRDGRVLVVGGADLSDGIDNLATAEIYDRYTKQFTRTGSMAQGRAGHTASLLPDGRVLVAGGFGGGTQPLATAEVYDPKTGKWSPTGSMTVARQDHTALMLDGGKILITGGMDAESHVLASAELYDPTTGTFQATGSMSTPRMLHTSTYLDGTHVMVAGGLGADGRTALASTEIYNTATGKFSKSASMLTARYGHTATQVSYGWVIVAGGRGTNSLEVYEPGTGKFGNQMALLGPVDSAVSLSDRVLLTGTPAQLFCPLLDPSSSCR